MEASCSKLQTSLWWWWIVNKGALRKPLMLYAKRDVALANMVASLGEELACVGLHLNTCKITIWKTKNLEKPMFLNIGGDMIDVLHEGQNNTYLVKKLFGGFFSSHLISAGFQCWTLTLGSPQATKWLLHWPVSRQRNDCLTGLSPATRSGWPNPSHAL